MLSSPLLISIQIIHNIDKIDKDKLFTFPTYTATRRHQFKLAKKQHRLKIRSNSFSLRVIDSWNALPEHVVMAPSLNCFKSRLNVFWKNTRISLVPGATVPDQNQETTTRMHQQRLFSLILVSRIFAYVSAYIKTFQLHTHIQYMITRTRHYGYLSTMKVTFRIERFK